MRYWTFLSSSGGLKRYRTFCVLLLIVVCNKYTKININIFKPYNNEITWLADVVLISDTVTIWSVYRQTSMRLNTETVYRNRQSEAMLLVDCR